MNALIVFSTLLAASQAQLLAAPYAAGFAPYYNGFNGYRAAGLPLAAHGYAAPIAAPLAAPIAAAPAIPAPLTAPSSQFHAQDEFANFNFGYSNINSAKQETGNAYGGRVGSYSYVDAHGIPQRVDYIADAAGFRVKATNLPVAPVHALESPVYTGVAPVPVQDTPEVAAAKAEHFAALEEAASRQKRDAQLIASPYTAGYAAPFAYNGYAAGYATPFAYNGLYNNGIYGYNGLYNNALPYAAAYAAPAAVAAAPIAAYAAAPVAAAPIAATYAAPAAVAAAPAARDAILTTIKLNPGHAVAYRVD